MKECEEKMQEQKKEKRTGISEKAVEHVQAISAEMLD